MKIIRTAPSSCCVVPKMIKRPAFPKLTAEKKRLDMTGVVASASFYSQLTLEETKIRGAKTRRKKLVPRAGKALLGGLLVAYHAKFSHECPPQTSLRKD